MTVTSEQLRAEAKRLADVLGPPPILWASEWPTATPELRAEFGAYHVVMDHLERWLAEFAGWDGPALWAAKGPPLEVGDHQPWQELLIGAARKSEYRNRTVDESALDLVSIAFFGALNDAHGDWAASPAGRARECEDADASLRRALELLPREAWRQRRSAAVSERARKRLTMALEQL